MWALRALLLGGAAAATLAYVFAGAAALLAAAAGADLHVGSGPFVLVAVDTSGGSTATTFGPGLAIAAVVGALANVLAGAVVRRRRDGGRIA